MIGYNFEIKVVKFWSKCSNENKCPSLDGRENPSF
jgi:hypothetical protein